MVCDWQRNEGAVAGGPEEGAQGGGGADGGEFESAADDAHFGFFWSVREKWWLGGEKKSEEVEMRLCGGGETRDRSNSDRSIAIAL